MSSAALKKLTRSMPKDGSNDILEDMKKETDRGAATLACSTVEYALRLFLIKHMIELSPGEEGRLFYNSGPLSDFGGMISVAHAFGLIDQKMKDDLLLLKDIRNAFGHSPQRVTFEFSAIKSRCERFHVLNVLKDTSNTAREQYTSAAKILFIVLKFSGAGQPLPLPFGMFYLPIVTVAPAERKRAPLPEISLEQFLQALESSHRDSKKPRSPPESSQA